MNPWNITPAAEKVLDALAETGCVKAAAHRIGMNHKTAAVHLWRARVRMGVATQLSLVLAWDRFRRNGEKKLMGWSFAPPPTVFIGMTAGPQPTWVPSVTPMGVICGGAA